MADIPTQRAILIGIDKYPVPDDRLRGAVQDVVDMKRFLVTRRGFQEENISIYATPHDDAHGQLMGVQSPTANNIWAALANLKEVAAPGEFIYIHFSGHGRRKKVNEAVINSPFIEYICALDEDIRDVDFGNQLDELASNGLNILVGLDCCFSGGATRNRVDNNIPDQAKVRCRPERRQDDGSPPRGNRNSGPAARGDGSRAPGLVATGPNRSRRYTVIAAAQPHEPAREYTDDNQVLHGRMTYFLLQCLNEQEMPRSYGRLQGYLQERCRRPTPNLAEQVPMILGKLDKTVFGASNAEGTPETVSHIDSPRRDRLRMNHGWAHGTQHGDKWQVYHVNGSKGPIVITYEVGDLHSWARKESRGEIDLRVEKGAMAILTERKAIEVNVFPIIQTAEEDTDEEPDQIDMQKTWSTQSEDLLDFKVNVAIAFTESSAKFNIGVTNEGVVCILDKRGHLIPYVPVIPMDMPGAYSRLWQWLRHLNAYNLVAGLKGESDSTKYRFSLTQREGQPNVLEFKFQNISNQVLYITLLGLSAAYEISQLYPQQRAPSCAVDSQGEHRCLIRLRISDLLLPYIPDSTFTTTDRFKLLITGTQTSFSHYELPSLLAKPPGPGREPRSVIENFAFHSEDFSFHMDRELIPVALDWMGLPYQGPEPPVQAPEA